MSTIKDVSRLANVSISTVSRVINNTAQVAPEKREAVLSAMKELNFRPNSFAQALVSKRSNCIGVLVGDLCGGPFFAQMMLGIERIIDKANKFTIVMSGNHDEQRERHHHLELGGGPLQELELPRPGDRVARRQRHLLGDGLRDVLEPQHD